MRIQTVSVLLLLIAIYYIISVAAEVFIDDYVKPRSMFAYLLVGTVLTSLAALAIDIDLPE